MPAALPVALSRRPSIEISDHEAITHVLQGRREMFEAIVRRYNPQLFRVGMAYLRRHDQAEDAMQNAYVKAFRNLDRFRRDSAFGTWLMRIMINECLMLLRRRKSAREAPADCLPFDLAAAEPAVAEAMNREETKILLEQAIAALPRPHRAVYVLREVQHLSTAETARCLGLSADNVKVRLHRARERLKAELLKSAAGIELFAYPAVFCNPFTARVLRAVGAPAAEA